MATLPAFFRRFEDTAEPFAPRGPVAASQERDPHMLRPLPHDSLYLFTKKIDNSRLVRESDPHGRGACWSAIGAAVAVVVLVGAAMAPSLANTLAGYQLEQLRADERRLVDERRSLELQEAELVSPQQLEKMASQRQLQPPAPGQVIHLNAKGDGAVAMVKE